RGGGTRRPLLEPRERVLAVEPPAVARQRAVLPDDAVAGDDDRDRRMPDARADGADDVGSAGAARELRVADRGAVRDLEQLGPDGELEIGAHEIELDVERPSLAGEVLLELGDDRGERLRVALRPVR